MSSRLRFTAARQVFEAFPKLERDVKVSPDDSPPLAFARTLLGPGKRFAAITFVAHLLPRREAVWWGCQCLRALDAKYANEPLLAAEAWVRNPEEDLRRVALKLGDVKKLDWPSTWMAMAAGNAGGSIAPEGSAYPYQAPPESTAVNVKAGVVLGIAKRPGAEHARWIEACVEAGLRFADGEELKVLPPAALAS